MGIVYDVRDCELGHHGEDVSFQSLMKKYDLEDPALRLSAECQVAGPLSASGRDDSSLADDVVGGLRMIIFPSTCPGTKRWLALLRHSAKKFSMLFNSLMPKGEKSE